MKQWILIAVVIVFQSQWWLAVALSGEIPPVVQKALPKVEVKSVTPIEVASPVYAVATPQGVLYLDASGRYLFTGELYDLIAQENLTQAHRQAIPKVQFDELPLSDAILYRSGKHRIAIFDDLDCPYCQKLHRELGSLDAEIHIFLFPLTDLHPLAYRKSVSVWCSPDKIAALDAVMSGKAVSVQDCEHPVDRILTLGAKLGLRATPTIILEDGRWIEGYRPVKELNEMLKSSK